MRKLLEEKNKEIENLKNYYEDKLSKLSNRFDLMQDELNKDYENKIKNLNKQLNDEKSAHQSVIQKIINFSPLNQGNNKKKFLKTKLKP